MVSGILLIWEKDRSTSLCHSTHVTFERNDCWLNEAYKLALVKSHSNIVVPILFTLDKRKLVMNQVPETRVLEVPRRNWLKVSWTRSISAYPHQYRYFIIWSLRITNIENLLILYYNLEFNAVLVGFSIFVMWGIHIVK